MLECGFDVLLSFEDSEVTLFPIAAFLAVTSS